MADDAKKKDEPKAGQGPPPAPEQPKDLVSTRKQKFKGVLFGAGVPFKRGRANNPDPKVRTVCCSDREVQAWRDAGLLMTRKEWKEFGERLAAEAKREAEGDDGGEPVK